MNRSKLAFTLTVVSMTWIYWSGQAFAADEDKPYKYWNFTFENDLFVGEDDGYTNGTGLTFGSGPFPEFTKENMPDWQHSLTKNLYISTLEGRQRGFANMYFQRMQTPEDLTRRDLIEDDVPYAGVLAWQGTMYAWNDRVSDQFSIYLGIVGPLSYAEQTQKFIHRLVSADKPEGWDNQLENEPVVKVEAQRVWTLHRSQGDGLQFDALGLAGAGIGNLETAAKGGFALRWGTNLAASLVSFSLQADRQLNPLTVTPKNDFYLYLGGRAGFVLNDIFIDGNTFRNSHSVALEHYQDEFSAGAVWSLGKCGFVFQVTSQSSKTEINGDRQKFGALSITYQY